MFDRISSHIHYGRLLTALLTAFLVFVVSLFLSRTPPLRMLELASVDQLFEIRGPLDSQDSPVKLVAISQQADSQIPERWPWPREVYGHLIDNLNRAGAKVIGIDVIFDQPDRHSLRSDSVLADAIAEHGNVVLSGSLLREGGQQQIVRPYQLFQTQNPSPFGLVTVNRDRDGVVRSYRMSRSHLDSTYHSLALELIRQYEGWDTSVTIQDRGNYFEFGDYRIPKYGSNSMMVNYHGGRSTFTEYSFDQIIDDRNYLTVDDREIWEYESVEEKQVGVFDDPEFGLLYTDDLEDKIVLIGSTMPELHDFFSTPFAPGESMPGYQIHAHALQTILSGNYIKSAGVKLNLSALLIASAITAFITVFTSPIAGLWLIIVLITGVGSGISYLFVYQAFNLELVPPILAIVLGYVGAQTYNYFAELREKSRIRNMFGSYVSPALVHQMVESEEEPQLGGEEEKITAFFADIQSFSAFSEKLPPKKLVELINEYLSEMTDILTEEGGTLDKYIGDAIVAMFGAPVPMNDHAYKACITSQRMQMKQKELRRKWQAEGDKWPDIVGQMQTRIGINTGEMVTGNLGSTTRFNYTMMGDNVNLAARCESGSKEYGAYTMVTEDTKRDAELFGDDCVFRYLDKIIVVGRTQPVSVYEIMGLRDYMDHTAFKCLELYNEAVNLYLHQEWDNAIRTFEESSRFEPNQPGRDVGIKTNPSLVMIERCKEMKADPPGQDWDGVYVMKSK